MAMIDHSTLPVAHKLPVLSTVSSSFADLVANWRAAVRVSAAWGALLVAVGGAAFALLVAAQETLAANPLLNLAVLYIPIVLYMLFAVSAAVGWHRLLLLGEAPPRLYLRLDRPVWRYVGGALLLGLLIWLVAILVGIPIFAATTFVLDSNHAQWTVTHIVLATGLSLVLYAIVMLAGMRLSIALPPRAIGAHMRFREAFAATRGNSWRIVAGVVLISVPIVLVHAVMNLLLDFQVRMANGDIDWLGITGFLATMLTALAALVAMTLVSVGYLSRTYRFFADKTQMPLQG